MNTNEFIKYLQSVDPIGNKEVTIDYKGIGRVSHDFKGCELYNQNGVMTIEDKECINIMPYGILDFYRNGHSYKQIEIKTSESNDYVNIIKNVYNTSSSQIELICIKPILKENNNKEIKVKSKYKEMYLKEARELSFDPGKLDTKVSRRTKSSNAQRGYDNATITDVYAEQVPFEMIRTTETSDNVVDFEEKVKKLRNHLGTCTVKGNVKEDVFLAQQDITDEFLKSIEELVADKEHP